MFVSVFWSAVLPCGFFVTSAALMINFWYASSFIQYHGLHPPLPPPDPIYPTIPPYLSRRSDKYALFNLWRRPPVLNARLVTLSRSMLQFTIFVHVVMARTFFANWCVSGCVSVYVCVCAY